MERTKADLVLVKPMARFIGNPFHPRCAAISPVLFPVTRIGHCAAHVQYKRTDGSKHVVGHAPHISGQFPCGVFLPSVKEGEVLCLSIPIISSEFCNKQTLFSANGGCFVQRQIAVSQKWHRLGRAGCDPLVKTDLPTAT